MAGGAGLLLLQSYAEQVEQETGVRVHVYGFDTGHGLPKLLDDYRDQPENWSAGDFPIDLDKLRPHLLDRTKLVLGDVRDTVPRFIRNELHAPVGFVSIDLDMYSSTRDALVLLSHKERRVLKRVILYLDDVDSLIYHRFAGELLAIEEFNEMNQDVKIDHWRGIRNNRPFPEHSWLNKIYVAYDLTMMGRQESRPQKRQILNINNSENL